LLFKKGGGIKGENFDYISFRYEVDSIPADSIFASGLSSVSVGSGR
jgi:hypothetical protein